MSKKDEKKVKVLERKLPADVANKYKLKTIRAGKFNFKGFGEIDLRTISIQKADALVAKGFSYLEITKKGKKTIADAKAEAKSKAAELVILAKGDLKEIDLTDIQNFDYPKGSSIINALNIKTSDKTKESYFEALKKAQAVLQSE